jgi:hypothetical protein
MSCIISVSFTINAFRHWHQTTLIEERMAYTLYLHRPDFVTQYSFFLNYFLRLNVVKWVLRPVSDLADVCRYRHPECLGIAYESFAFTHFMSATSGIISIYDKIVKFYAFWR